ncbi:MAG: mismatch-specific DNA-glycosylase, partial [Nocardioides sp.]
FYPALYAGAIIEEPIDPAAGMTDAQRTMMTSRGIAITNLVRRATARADELSPSELTEGGLRLRRLVAERAPRVVAVAGITAYRTAFGDRSARVGRQPVDWGSSQVWVVPNPSGLNAHETVVTLAAAYRAAAVAARVVGEPTPAV